MSCMEMRWPLRRGGQPVFASGTSHVKMAPPKDLLASSQARGGWDRGRRAGQTQTPLYCRAQSRPLSRGGFLRMRQTCRRPADRHPHAFLLRAAAPWSHGWYAGHFPRWIPAVSSKTGWLRDHAAALGPISKGARVFVHSSLAPGSPPVERKQELAKAAVRRMRHRKVQ